MKSIVRIFNKSKKKDYDLGDIIHFNRAIVGRDYDIHTIREAFDLLIPKGNYYRSLRNELEADFLYKTKHLRKYEL